MLQVQKRLLLFPVFVLLEFLLLLILLFALPVHLHGQNDEVNERGHRERQENERKREIHVVCLDLFALPMKKTRTVFVDLVFHQILDTGDRDSDQEVHAPVGDVVDRGGPEVLPKGDVHGGDDVVLVGGRNQEHAQQPRDFPGLLGALVVEHLVVPLVFG